MKIDGSCTFGFSRQVSTEGFSLSLEAGVVEGVSTSHEFVCWSPEFDRDFLAVQEGSTGVKGRFSARAALLSVSLDEVAELDMRRDA